MSKVCAICGKKPHSGRTIARRGLAKKKGGAGRRITGITKRRFLPNLQRVKVIFQGVPKTIMVCTRCIKAGKIKKLK
jgi:large subunit ribosomal protein L28